MDQKHLRLGSCRAHSLQADIYSHASRWQMRAHGHSREIEGMDRRRRSRLLVCLLVRKPRLQVFPQPLNARTLESFEAQKVFEVAALKNDTLQPSYPSLHGQILTKHSMLSSTRFAMKISHSVCLPRGANRATCPHGPGGGGVGGVGGVEGEGGAEGPPVSTMRRAFW